MIWIGTSGYNYPEWRGSFYPTGFSQTKMLSYYGAQFPTVEINYTFKQMPSDKALSGWANGTPGAFRLALKAPERITHFNRLRNCAEIVADFGQRVQGLGDKLGPILFQLPPNFKKDLPLLEDFCAGLPAGLRATFEFRHASWFDEGVFDCLRAHDLALCIADSEKLTTPGIATARYAYFRLRDEGYTPADIATWAGRVREVAGSVQDVFVYFKHEATGKGPELARAMMAQVGGVQHS